MVTCTQCGKQFDAPLAGEGLCPECRLRARPEPARRLTVEQYVRRFPATTLLLVINIGVFLAMWVSHVSPVSPSVNQLLRWGATSGEKVLFYNQWWRVVTSAFVHIGAAHLILNMWSLWLMGTLAEAVLGTSLYVGGYLICAIAGSITSLYWNPVVVEAGASGALMGILGILLSVLTFARLPVPRHVVSSTTRSLAMGAALTLAIGILPHIANSAHVGGLVCGLILGFLLSLTRRASYVVQRPLRWACLLLPLLLMFPFALAAQRHGRPWLHYARAFNALRESKLPQAEEEGRAAQRHLPRDTRILEILGVTLAYEGKDAEAGKYLREVLAREPQNPWATNALATIELKEGDAVGARDLLTKALAEGSDNAYGEVYLGRALQQLNDDDGAILRYRKALAINPDLYDAQMALGSLYEKRGKPKQAIRFYGKAAELQPQQIEPLQALVRAYSAAGMRAQADKTLAEIEHRESAQKEAAASTEKDK